MEFLALQLTKVYGTSAGQAFAWTMSIRLIQVLWNLTGGLFVFRGNYHPPSEREQTEVAGDDSPIPLPAARKAASAAARHRMS